MKETLPLGWEEAAIGDVASIKTGKLDANAAVKHGEYPFFTCAQEESRIDHFAFDTKAVLLAGNGVINVKRYSDKFNAYQRTYVIEPIGIDFDYCFFAIQKVIEEIAKADRGSVIKYLRLGDVANPKIPLPPLAEQRRIVAKLDALRERSSKAREELDHIPRLIERYKQAVLSAAFKGKLEHNTDYNPLLKDKYGLWSIPDSWQWVRAKEICEPITKGTTPPKDQMTSNHSLIPYIKVYNLTFNGTLDFTVNPTFVSKEVHSSILKRSRVYPDDVLMNIVGPPLGKVSIVPKTFHEWNINQAIAIFRPKPEALSSYVCYYLLYKNTVEWCVEHAKATAGQSNLTLAICQSIPIPLPSKQEQLVISNKIQSMFSRLESLEHQRLKTQNLLNKIDQSILSKAFCGELVRQNIEDEPASVLLERIQAERDAREKLKPARKKAKPRVQAVES